MKVTGYVGSPRTGGNSDVLVDTFLEGASSSGAEVKKYFLADCEINQCRGCFQNCMLQPGRRCAVHRDDMDSIIEDIVSSDVNIFASPLYCSVYSAIMARFFERCLPLWHVEIVGEPGTMDAFKFIENGAQGTKAVVALVQDFKDPSIAELAFSAYEHTVAKTYGMDIIEKLHVTDIRNVGDIKNKPEELDKIFAAGKKLAG